MKAQCPFCKKQVEARRVVGKDRSDTANISKHGDCPGGKCCVVVPKEGK